MTRRRGTLITLLLIALIGGLGILQLADWRRDHTPDAAGVARATAPRRLAIGATTLSLARNPIIPWKAADLGEVDAFERAAGTHAEVVMWFADLAGTPFRLQQAQAVAARDAVPEISFEPWDASNPSANQPRYRLATFLRGDHDAALRRVAQGIAIYHHPLRLRFAHEMNGTWYPWAERANGNAPGEYVRVWRHVRRIFSEVGATNVTWIWSPVAGRVTRGLFPGTGQVDVVAVSGFNGGTELYRRRWRSFTTAFGPTLDAVHTLAPALPVELSEIASAETGGSKAAWIRGMFADLRGRPYVRTLVWFNLKKETDWRITSSASARAAFAQGVAADPGTAAAP